MAEEKKQEDNRQQPEERPAEPPSPATTIEREQEELPGEGELPRREDMGPADHRPRKEQND